MRPVARAILSRMQAPLVWSFLTALLVADAGWISEEDTPSTCGAAIWEIFHGWSTGCGVQLPVAWVCRTQTGYDFTRRQDWIRRSTNLPIAGVYHGMDRQLRGFWALMHEAATETLEVRGWGPPEPSDKELDAILAAYLGAHPDLAHLAAGPVRTSRVLWPGVAHSAAAAAVGALWLGSLPWMWRWWPRRLESSRLAAGLCPQCAYDLRTGGLAACPECGWGRA